MAWALVLVRAVYKVGVPLPDYKKILRWNVLQLLFRSGRFNRTDRQSSRRPIARLLKNLDRWNLLRLLWSHHFVPNARQSGRKSGRIYPWQWKITPYHPTESDVSYTADQPRLLFLTNARKLADFTSDLSSDSPIRRAIRRRLNNDKWTPIPRLSPRSPMVNIFTRCRYFHLIDLTFDFSPTFQSTDPSCVAQR